MTKMRAILAAALVACASAALLAVPGVLDTSFNGTGLATTDFAIAGIGTYHQATAVAVDSRRRTVAVGLTNAGPDITAYDVALARYNPDGTPDATFGDAGKVIYDVGGDDRAAAVAIDSQDRILVAGSSDWRPGCNSFTCGGNFNFFVLRFNTDGSIDASYGDQGQLIVDSGHDSDWATAMAIDADGRAVVAGWAVPDDHAEIALLRVMPDGTRDTSFGGDGLVISEYTQEPFFATATGLTIAPDGAYIIPVDLAGFATVARYQPDGQPAGFYHPPIVGFGFTAGDECFYARLTSAAVDSSGRIVATGYCAGDNWEGPGISIITIRLMPDGRYDPSFGLGGGIFSHFGVTGVGKMEAHGVAVDGLGNITIGGVAQSDGCGLDMLIAHFDASGAPDPTFGTAGDGSSLVDFGGCTDDSANAMTTDRFGDFVLAGASVSSPVLSNFAVARVLTVHPDYRFVEPVAPIGLVPGGNGSTTLTLSSIDGFHDTLKIAPFGPLPAGFSYGFDGIAGPKTVDVPAGQQVSTTFDLTIAPTVGPGTYELPVFDLRLPDPSHTAVVTVNVLATPGSVARTIDTLVQTGEIDNPGIGRSLARQIAAGQYAAAKHHVEAQTGEHITAGAAAILIANIEDLIRQAAH